MWNKFFLCNIFWVTTAFAGMEPPKSRISVRLLDLGRVHPIYMMPRLATIIEIPGPVTGVRVGSPEDLQFIKPETPDNEVTLFLRSSHSKPTNLIIRSGKRKYVFDIVPSHTKHQDLIEVVGSVGVPTLDGDRPLLIDSSDSNPDRKQGGPRS